MAGNKSKARKIEKKAKPYAANGAALAALWTIALILAAIAIIAVSSLLLPGIGHAIRPGPERFDAPPGGMMAQSEEDISFLEENMALRFGLSALNIILAIYLLFIYVKDYLSLRTSFTLGIIAVLFSFLLYALTSSPLMRMVIGPLGIASTLSFVPMLFSALGLLIFAKLGNE
jgi:hypothetical protein